MAESREPPAVARWVIQHNVFIFYGNGGAFTGEPFERWFQALEATADLRLYVGGAGSTFSFGPQERSRSNDYFKRNKLRFSVVTDSIRLRLLGQTARLVGLDLGLYSWDQSQRPFAERGLSRSIADQLHDTLLSMRVAVETELQQTGR